MAKKMTEAQAEAYRERRRRDIVSIGRTLAEMHDVWEPDHVTDKQFRKLIDRCAAYKRDYG